MIDTHPSDKGIVTLRTLVFRGCLVLLWLSFHLFAQESPYIVTYDHHLEEPGNLEVEYFSTFGTQRAGNDFHAYWMEFEYGTTAWWTTEFYLDGQTTFQDSTLFTGFRWENRFRPLRTEHFINPVVYIEYENISEADKIIKEVEGHDVASDHADSNAALRKTHNHELEFKPILSKDFHGWNFAVNPLATKNLSPNNPWEFGYAMGQPSAGTQGFRQKMRLLPGEFHRRCRALRRPRRHAEFRPPRNFALPRPRSGLESAFRLDCAAVAWIWFE